MPPRPRTRDRHLPRCVYRSHGAYYLVRRGTWTHLGRDLGEALATYARLIDEPQSGLSTLLDRVIEDARGRVRPNTIAQYQIAARELARIFAEFRPEQIRPRHVAQLMDHYRDRPNMGNRLRTVLKIAFDQAVRSGLVETNPVTPIKPHPEKRRSRYLTDAEYRAIWNAASPLLRCVIDLCYLTAQRIGDVLAIQLADLTADGVLIRQAKTARALLIRWTPDLRDTVAHARALLPERRVVQLQGGGYLLGQRNGRIRSYRGVRDQWHRACERAAVSDAHLHDLRAKSLTDADNAGLDAQQLAGHTSPAMTRRYLRDRTPVAVTGPRLRR